MGHACFTSGRRGFSHAYLSQLTSHGKGQPGIVINQRSLNSNDGYEYNNQVAYKKSKKEKFSPVFLVERLHFLIYNK